MHPDPPIIIVGGGLAGLSCARHLVEAGHPVLVLERDDEFGGRVRTDTFDGFQLDRGFQVLQTAYPEAQQQLDYEALDLKSYTPGALIYKSGLFHRFIDPWRRPWDGIWSGLRSGIGTFGDRLRVANLRAKCKRGEIDDLFAIPEQSTWNSLVEFGFSSEMIESFFRPFLGGVFLERELKTSNRMMMFVFRMFSQGDVAIPARGMQAISQQMMSRVPADSLRAGCYAKRVSENEVELENGELIKASRVILATPAHITAELLNRQPPGNSRRVRCLYFSCQRPPISEPILVLNGEADGPINNLSVPSIVSSELAPIGRHLVSVSVIDKKYVGDRQLESIVIKQCELWFGEQVHDWKLLKQYDIRHALPDQFSGINLQTGHASMKNGLIICGDHLGHGSIQSALKSGRRAAEIILA
jgi:phytoene dehydrogenase-like protein